MSFVKKYSDDKYDYYHKETEVLSNDNTFSSYVDILHSKKELAVKQAKTNQDIKLNAKLKQEEIEALNLAADPNNAVDAGESLEDIIPNITEDLKERIKRAVLKKKRKKKKSSDDDETQEEE